MISVDSASLAAKTYPNNLISMRCLSRILAETLQILTHHSVQQPQKHPSIYFVQPNYTSFAIGAAR